jgi:hypothetical protein
LWSRYALKHGGFGANQTANRSGANQKKGPFAVNLTGNPSNCVQQKTDPAKVYDKTNANRHSPDAARLGAILPG